MLLRKARERKGVDELADVVNDTELAKGLTVAEMTAAELEMIKLVQKHNFNKELSFVKPEIGALESHRHIKANSIPRTSPLARLDPFVDDHRVIRVGRIIRRSSMDNAVKYPVIVPKKSHIS